MFSIISINVEINQYTKHDIEINSTKEAFFVLTLFKKYSNIHNIDYKLCIYLVNIYMIMD